MDILAEVEKGKYSLEGLIESLAEYSHKKYPHWEKRYSDLVIAAQTASTYMTPENDELLKRLWYVRDNGIANIRQGGFSLEEFERNLPLFRSITDEIRQRPNEETYQKITQKMRDAKKDGSLSRMYYALRNRIFSAFIPHVCTTTVDYKSINKTVGFLNANFKLNLPTNGNHSWLFINNQLKQTLRTSLNQPNDIKINMAVWGLFELLNQRQKMAEQQEETQSTQGPISQDAPQKTLHTPINKIYFGPPGTGKTFKLQEIMADYISPATHADYTTWLDAHLKQLNWMQITALVLLDLRSKAKVRQLTEHVWFQRKALLNGRIGNLSQTAWATLQSFTVPESTTVDYKNRREPAIFDKTADSEWFLVDSKREQIEDLAALYHELKRGPEKDTKIQRFAFVTFHQSYGYEEFIEGIRPRSDENNNISYPIEPGIFLQLCQRAKADPEHRYAIFIDEINRGNISKIFGELIALIEIDKRESMENALSLQLAYSCVPFNVPANVDIIGAMNTADRSLALMDTALRRRFDFIEMMPDLSRLSDVKVKGIDIESLLEKLNSRIEALYDREHTLGHAFFMPVKIALEKKGEDAAFDILQAVFKKKIIPLLKEYFFDDWNKIRLILADNQKKNDGLQFVIEKENDLDALFGDDYSLHQREQKQASYALKETESDGSDNVWDNPLAYRAIYDPKAADIADADEHNE